MTNQQLACFLIGIHDRLSTELQTAKAQMPPEMWKTYKDFLRREHKHIPALDGVDAAIQDLRTYANHLLTQNP